MSGGAEEKYVHGGEDIPPPSLDSEFKIRTPSPANDLDDSKNTSQPKDPRSKYKYNILFRFFFL